MASRVRSELSDKELIDIFMSILQGLYFEKMIGSSSSNFADIVTIGKRIKNEVKSGKIIGIIPQQVVTKNPQGVFSKNKEGETSVVLTSVHPHFQALMALMSFCSYPYIGIAQYQQLPF